MGARRRIVRATAWVPLALGVALLAWAFTVWQWGDPVTGLYTSWEQRHLAAEYQRLRESFPKPKRVESARPRVRRQVTADTAEHFRHSAPEGGAIGILEIRRLGLDMVLLNGTDESTLRRGPGRDPRTFMPGEGELVYIAGHRTTYGAPFAHIDRLKRGDRVVVEMPYGRFVYGVTRSVIVPADDVARLRTKGVETLALQACHPRFSARERYIVYAAPLRETIR